MRWLRELVEVLQAEDSNPDEFLKTITKIELHQSAYPDVTDPLDNLFSATKNSEKTQTIENQGFKI